MSHFIALFAVTWGTVSAQLPAPVKEWTPFSVSFDPKTPGLLNARDLLNAPAGRDGFVTARDGHFYTGEKRIRFWGVNMCFAANFPSHEQADQVADRLANFGVNAVRFHHMDSAPFPRGIFADESLETLSTEAMDRLDYFIAALKTRGIYSNLNLHVSRSWTRSHKWPDAEKLPKQDKMIDLFHPELIAAQKQYAKDLLTHLNPYTKLRYVDEPAVAMIEINNENTFFIWDGIKTLAKMPSQYQRILAGRWSAWLNENPLKYPSVFEPSAMSMHWFAFLQSVDEGYFTSMRSYLRDELGVRQPITGTIVLGPLGMKSQSKMDFADAHWYWDHPTFPRKQWDSSDWLIENKPMISQPERTPMRLAASRIASMPFTVTEYNHAAPNEYQSECIPFIATYAALQDWDAVFLFAYSHDTNYFKEKTGSFFDIEGNPAKMAMLPFGARIFLQPLFEPLDGSRELTVDMNSVLRSGSKYYQDISGYLRDSQHLDTDGYTAAMISVNLNSSSNRKAGERREGLVLLNEPIFDILAIQDGSAAVMISSGKLSGWAYLGRFDLEGDTRFFSLVMISAEPGKHIRLASRFYVCVIGRTGNDGMAWNPSRTTVGKNWGVAPSCIEPIRLSLLKPGTTIYPLDEAGRRGKEPVKHLGDGNTVWYEVIIEEPKN